MRKHLALVLAAALLALLPALATAEGASVSDCCQQAAQAQTSDAMVQSINAAFAALKVEAQADATRAAEMHPEVLDFNDEGEDSDELRLNVHTIEQNGKKMRFIVGEKGRPDESGYPLYITLHGGGTTTPDENDTQWYSMYDYYRSSVEDGIYVACRGMEDVWNMHSLPEAYAIYDRIIEDMVLMNNADPNRVYLLGFSAGGDGVYEITPRMADRFAAANMSSGHPNKVSLLNVANVPFQIQVGITDFYDTDAKRCVRGAEFQDILNGYHDTYGFGYEHRVLVHVPEGHNFNDCSEGAIAESMVLKGPSEFARRAVDEDWLKDFVDICRLYYGNPANPAPYDDMVTQVSYHCLALMLEGFTDEQIPEGTKKYEEFCAALTKKITGTDDGEYAMETEVVDTDAVNYVNKFVRNYCPRQLVWGLSTRAAGRSVSSFYWLKADKSVDKGLITASFDANSNTFTLNPSGEVTDDFKVLINPHMVDVSRPVTLITPKGTFTVPVEADAKVVEASLREVTDPFLAWVQEVSYQELGSSEEPPVPDEPTAPAQEGSANGSGVWTKDSGSAGKPAAGSTTSKPAAKTTASGRTATQLPKTGDTPLTTAVCIAALGLAAITAAHLLRLTNGDGS